MSQLTMDQRTAALTKAMLDDLNNNPNRLNHWSSWGKWDTSLWQNDYQYFHEEYAGLTYSEWDRMPMTDNRDPKRQTGRTSDMLWNAAQIKDEGGSVIILVHNERMVRYCLDTLLGGWWGLDKVDFLSVEGAARSIRGWRFPDTICIDHFIETLVKEDRKFAQAWNQLANEIRMERERRYPEIVYQPKVPTVVPPFRP